MNKPRHQNNASNSNSGKINPGLVVANFGAKLIVEDNQGVLHRCTARRKLGSLVCGDRVRWQGGEHNDCAVIELQQRQSELARPDKSGRKKTIAANIDQVLIMTSPGMEFSTNLIDRYLVTAETLAIHPLIILNKIDLLGDTELTQIRQQLAMYENIGYPVILTSSKTAHGLDALQPYLLDKTSIVVGKSGVGKSSLINQILPDAAARVGDISQATGKGTHTTTTARLYHLPGNNGDIIDSPGIREFGLWQITTEQVAQGFREFRDYSELCRFRDCRHISEPGCAVVEAVDQGKITPARYNSYQRILASLDEPLK